MANSTASSERQGSRRRITSVLNILLGFGECLVVAIANAVLLPRWAQYLRGQWLPSGPTICEGASQGQGSHRRTEDLAAPQRLDRAKTTMNGSGMLRESNEQGVLAKVRGGNRGQNRAPSRVMRAILCAAAARTNLVDVQAD